MVSTTIGCSNEFLVWEIFFLTHCMWCTGGFAISSRIDGKPCASENSLPTTNAHFRYVREQGIGMSSTTRDIPANKLKLTATGAELLRVEL
jgi:hypothetical protein